MVPAPPGSVLIIISSVLWIAETISEDYVLITNVSFCFCQAYFIMWYPYNVRFAGISWLKPNQIFWTPSFKWTIMNIELSFVLMEDVSWLRIPWSSAYWSESHETSVKVISHWKSSWRLEIRVFNAIPKDTLLQLYNSFLGELISQKYLIEVSEILRRKVSAQSSEYQKCSQEKSLQLFGNILAVFSSAQVHTSSQNIKSYSSSFFSRTHHFCWQ